MFTDEYHYSDWCGPPVLRSAVEVSERNPSEASLRVRRVGEPYEGQANTAVYEPQRLIDCCSSEEAFPRSSQVSKLVSLYMLGINVRLRALRCKKVTSVIALLLAAYNPTLPHLHNV